MFDLTPNQVRSFWAAWGGWAMDGMDSFIYALVLAPAMRDLLPEIRHRAHRRERRLLRRDSSLHYSWSAGAWRCSGDRSPTASAACAR